MINLSDGRLSILSSDMGVKFISVRVDTKKCEPFLFLKGDKSRIVVGVEFGDSLDVHFKNENELLRFCQGQGLPIHGLLDRIEQLRYEVAA
ncbi:hypothetical protein [Pseudoteredinibacter isoporae]|uniref:hypothetical protein n=1 Tax=Pseudoteredinibacter isoporae TaxID=570281 RepID=UPI0031022F88